MIKKMWHHIKRRWLTYIIAYAAKVGIYLIMRTCRIKIKGLDAFIATATQSPCILMLWHNRMVVLPDILYRNAAQFNYTAFISKSRDGDPLALIAESYAVGHALRVPHNARHSALGKMIQQLRNPREIMLFTPDGPRGPRYEVKPGIVLAAWESGAKIVPFSWEAERVWSLKTWDGMMIPKLFAKIEVSFGMPLSLYKKDGLSIEEEADRLKSVLMDTKGRMKDEG